jgi:hypothetical protein
LVSPTCRVQFLDLGFDVELELIVHIALGSRTPESQIPSPQRFALHEGRVPQLP